MMKFRLIFILLLSSALFFNTGCGGEKASRVYLKINLTAGGQPLQLNTDYTTPEGNLIQYSMVRFYVSQVSLIKDNNEEIHYPDNYYLADSQTENLFLIDEALTGKFKGIRFGLGVDSTRNDSSGIYAIPAYEYPADHALSPANFMYWSWNPGYIFMKLEGKVDTSGNGILNEIGETFSIHTGFKEAYVFIERNYSFTTKGDDIILQINAEIPNFFTNYNLRTKKKDAHPSNSKHEDFPYVLEIVNNSNLVFGNIFE
jgi:hypothetical protein